MPTDRPYFFTVMPVDQKINLVSPYHLQEPKKIRKGGILNIYRFLRDLFTFVGQKEDISSEVEAFFFTKFLTSKISYISDLNPLYQGFSFI